MKKIVLTIIMGIFLISLASALTYDIIAGELVNITLPEEYEYYSIVGNSSPVDLEITQNGLNITIIMNKYSPADSFEVIFFNKEKEIIELPSDCPSCKRKYRDRIVEVPKDCPTCDPAIGGEIDEHGCYLMAGYTWCEAKQKCLREWEEPCESEKPKTDLTTYILIVLFIGIVLLIILIVLINKLQKKREVKNNGKKDNFENRHTT